MFIKALEIKNFQCHHEARFDFAEGINAIVGESDRGKSAILRALRWVLLNKPEGTQMRRHGSKDAVVSVTLDNDTTITRIRSKTVNRYILDISGEKPQYYDSFGKNIPEPVLEQIGNLHADLGDRAIELSMANQFESPFLLTDSGIARAQVLGKISKTSLLDEAIKVAGVDVRNHGKTLKFIDEGLAKATEYLSEYDNLDKEIKQLEKIEKFIEAIQAEATTIQRGAQIQVDVERLDRNIAERERRIAKLENLPDLTKIEELAASLQRGEQILGELAANAIKVSGLVATLEAIDALTPELIAEFEETGEQLQRAEQLQKEVKTWKASWTQTNRGVRSANEELSNLTRIYLDLIRESGHCPTCFAFPVDEETLARIEQELIKE